MTVAINEPSQAEADLLVFHEIARRSHPRLTLSRFLRRSSARCSGSLSLKPGPCCLPTKSGETSIMRSPTGAFGSRLFDVRVPFGEGMAGWVAERGEPLIIADASHKDVPYPGVDAHLDFEVRSAVCIPLRSRLRTVGVIQLFNLPPEMLSESAISFLLCLRLCGDRGGKRKRVSASAGADHHR